MINFSYTVATLTVILLCNLGCVTHGLLQILTMKVVEEKSIKLSESFSPVMENIKLPNSIFADGSHFIFSHDGKLLVLCDMKKYYNSNGRYVVLFDLQNEMLA